MEKFAKLDPFNLLVGDLPKLHNSATPQPAVNYNMPPPLLKTSPITNPLLFEAVSNTTRQKIPQSQQFLAANTILQPADSFFLPTAVNSSSSIDFADFDAKFNSLKVENTQQNLFSPLTSSFLPKKNDSFNKPQQIHHQLNSMLPSSSTSNTTSLVSWSTSNAEPQKDHSLYENQKKAGVTSDGRPIMSKPADLPDYSALEELFRGPSQKTNTSENSVFMPSLQSSNINFGTANNFSNYAATSVDAFNSFLVSKSNTTTGFSDFSSLSVGTNNDLSLNQFYSVSNFPSMYSQPSTNLPLASSLYTQPQFLTNSSSQVPIHNQNNNYLYNNYYYSYYNPYSFPASDEEKTSISQCEKKRNLFSSSQVKVLESYFQKDRYINGTQREIIAKQTGLSSNQVKIWYQNRRYKDKKMRKDTEFLMNLNNLI